MTIGPGARRALIAALLAAPAGCLAGCLEGCGEPQQTVPQGVDLPAEPAWNPQVRRPRWRFVFEKTAERCVVLRIDDGERVTRGDEAPCPVDLQPGERIRLAGSVCVREGPDARRVLPVVCPDPLTNAEREFLESEGLVPK